MNDLLLSLRGYKSQIMLLLNGGIVAYMDAVNMGMDTETALKLGGIATVMAIVAKVQRMLQAMEANNKILADAAGER